MAIRGALGACLIDYSTGLVISAAGRRPHGNHEVTAAGVTDVVRAIIDGGPFAQPGEPDSVRDIVVTAGNGYHLVQFVAARFDVRVVMYLWLDATSGNLALTQWERRASNEDRGGTRRAVSVQHGGTVHRGVSCFRAPSP
jgi:hypothetical protein